MGRTVIDARAKLNISLDVLGRRDDGYHDMLMVMQDVELFDTIEVEKTRLGHIRLMTNLKYLPTDERNLAKRAAEAFYNISGVPLEGVDIKIHKRIPVAAGLAGGSADAAGVLKALNEIHETNFTTKELCCIGKTLGADVPYCIFGGTALAEGIGERLTRLDSLADCFFVIARPGVSVSTKNVFRRLDVRKIKYRPDTDGILKALKNNDLGGVARRMINVLEPVTAGSHRIVYELKNILLDSGAMGAQMSGSGPSVFGVFDSLKPAREAKERLLEQVSEVFVVKHEKK